MAAAAANLHNRSEQQQQPPPTEDDAALRSNTDCVYFLASPLTCKKGSECEYRHSEYARINPRDCWFWLNGNCMNPKCSFRHPPLEGLLGTQAATAIGSFPATSQAAVSAATHVPPYNGNKNGVPCVFFQKGFCVKGDRCAFLHGPNPVGNKIVQAPKAQSVNEPSFLKKTFAGLAKCSKEQKTSEVNVMQPFEASHVKTEAILTKREVSIQKSPLVEALDAEIPRYKPTAVPAVNGSSLSRSNHMSPQSQASDENSFQNGKDADDIKESSPGFDVLVDDEVRDDDYYHNEDQYGRTEGGFNGQCLNSMNEVDLVHSVDYNSMVEFDRERLRERMQGTHARETYRAPSERMLMGTAHESDLRHHLSKQRRANGLRSVICQNDVHKSHIEEQSYKGSQRDSRLPAHDSSISSRLWDRITLPPNNGSELQSGREFEFDRRMNRERLSPAKPRNSFNQGRLRDRLKGIVAPADLYYEERNFRGPRSRVQMMDGGNADFASPKSLAELKGGKKSDNEGQQRKLKVDSYQQLEGGTSFEGPKPLSVILKRKREADASGGPGGVTVSEESEDSDKKNIRESLKSILSSPPEKKTNHGHNNEGGNKSKEDSIGTEDVKNVDDELTENQKDEYYQYEHEEDIDGEENADPDVYLDEDEGDDFAMKIGVI